VILKHKSNKSNHNKILCKFLIRQIIKYILKSQWHHLLKYKRNINLGAHRFEGIKESDSQDKKKRKRK
uniref:Uncharacterized protein n=1 Tax=Oryza brachyantha TaxID=4533 RepID=J3MG09_ORYBR